jgi:hypothetical protein
MGLSFRMVRVCGSVRVQITWLSGAPDHNDIFLKVDEVLPRVAEVLEYVQHKVGGLLAVLNGLFSEHTFSTSSFCDRNCC